MKNLILILLTCMAFIGCEKTENDALIDESKIIEQKLLDFLDDPESYNSKTWQNECTGMNELECNNFGNINPFIMPRIVWRNSQGEYWSKRALSYFNDDIETKKISPAEASTFCNGGGGGRVICGDGAIGTQH